MLELFIDHVDVQLDYELQYHSTGQVTQVYLIKITLPPN